MQRRTILKSSAALGTIGLAGCVDGGNGDGDGNGNGNSDGTETPTPEDPSGFSGFGDYGVSTTNTDCDNGNAGTADVAFDADAISVTVTGTLQASTPCYEASFEGVKYDTDADEIRITIAAKEDESVDGCIECVGAIEYEATLDLEGGLPSAVVVKHGNGSDAEVVADVTHDGGE